MSIKIYWLPDDQKYKEPGMGQGLGPVFASFFQEFLLLLLHSLFACLIDRSNDGAAFLQEPFASFQGLLNLAGGFFSNLFQPLPGLLARRRGPGQAQNGPYGPAQQERKDHGT